jgi:hypothetical protein
LKDDPALVADYMVREFTSPENVWNLKATIKKQIIVMTIWRCKNLQPPLF